MFIDLKKELLNTYQAEKRNGIIQNYSWRCQLSSLSNDGINIIEIKISTNIMPEYNKQPTGSDIYITLSHQCHNANSFQVYMEHSPR